MATRAPFVTYDSTLLDHMSVGAASFTTWTAIRLASVLSLTALTAVAAQMSVHLPFTPVPMTLQPIVVLMGAAALGARLGASSQALYVLLGVAGLPIFAASPILPQGMGRVLGPTGGYLLAYPLAAFVTGWLAERGFDRRFSTSALAMTAGLCTLFAGGVAWLAFVAGGAGRAAGFETALATGLYPFFAVDLAGVLAVSLVLPVLWKIVGRARWGD